MYLKLKIHPQSPHICVPRVFLFAVVGRVGGALFDVLSLAASSDSVGVTS